MKHHLSPKYSKKIGDYVIVWFEKSNSYILLNEELNRLLNLFLISTDETSFIKALERNDYSKIESKKIFYDIAHLLESQNIITSNKSFEGSYEAPINNNLSEYYNIWNTKVLIKYSSEKVKKLIHPSLAYLSDTKLTSHDIEFSIYHKDKELVLVKNTNIVFRCLAKEYHKLQGKFSLLLMNLLHKTKESDYLACFHATTVSIASSAIMLIGSSGSGKSTLSAILQQEGYNIVADDVSYMCNTDLTIKAYPAAISIKEGSLETLKKYYPKIQLLPKTQINPTKGSVRYIPLNNTDNKKPLTCNTIILVNYSPKAGTKLESASIKDILEVIIPESWISHDSISAQKFLNWLEAVNFYRLTYSNSDTIAEYLNSEIT